MVSNKKSQIFNLQTWKLRGINAGLLHLIEDNKSNEEDADAQHRADDYLMESHGPLPHESAAECFNHKDDWIEIIKPSIALRNNA